MFYVFHSGGTNTDDERVPIIDPEKLAELVVEAGLVDWLIRKVFCRSLDQKSIQVKSALTEPYGTHLLRKTFLDLAGYIIL